MKRLYFSGSGPSNFVARLAAAAGFLLAAAAAQATPIVDFSVGTCTGANCDSIEFIGRVSGTASESSPWTVETFAGGSNECLRLQVLTQGGSPPVNLEMVVVSPNGLVYRNDNGGLAPCTTCPVVKILSTVRGNYSVSISQTQGSNANARFRFAYGRYNSANPNCANATPAF
jgi:hypothetical protein